MNGMRLRAMLEAAEMEGLLAGRGLRGAVASAKAVLFAQAAHTLAGAGLSGEAEARGCWVPGRIEVLGKHTDYGAGRSIVTAVEQGFCTAVVPRRDATVRVFAAATGEAVAFALDPDLTPTHGHWSNYPMTVARRLARNFPGCRRGADIAFVSDLPPASGMSSSSALIVTTYLALAGVNHLTEEAAFRRNVPDALSLASFLGTVENGQNFGDLAGDRGVGTFGGSEDHTAMLCSEAGRLGQFAYCPARLERRIPMPEGYVFAVGFSGVVAEKTGAAQDLYNRASARVGAIVDAWRRETGGQEIHLAPILAGGPVGRLREILSQMKAGPFRAGELLQRLDHFIAENGEIVGPAGDALMAGDVAGFGRLVDRSQQLTETLLDNQVPETVALARLARKQGASAASAFGAGFGGSVWALVRTEDAGAFLGRWSDAYARAFPEQTGRALFLLTQAGPAAFEIA